MRGRRTSVSRTLAIGLALTLVWVVGSTFASRLAAAPDRPALVTLSIVGTSDLHGVAFPRNGLGGLPLLAGFMKNLRAVRQEDGGAVLLVDAGDTFQGDVDSNLSEGALVVDAYNAMGYAAEAVGNHDFDFGTVDSPTARQMPGDLRGALKARAAQARYPFLAANLIDDATERVVEWPNVRPSAIVDAAGVQVGIIGVMTIDAMRSTLAANVQGLRMAPLGPAIATEASTLRAAGAEVVVVVSHAGGRCERFDAPEDLSSCDGESEIFQVARSLPPGLVDVIAAGHTHAGLAHQVNGIGIIQPFSRGQSFGRVDVVFDRQHKRVARLQLFAPRNVCAQQDPATGHCAAASAPGTSVTYEGRVVTPDQVIVQAMAPALERIQRMRAITLGVSLDVPLRLAGDLGSPMGNAFADALHEAVPDADAAVVSNAARGLRADLAAGPLMLGQLYDVFPFDNRIVRVTLSGAALSRWVTAEIGQGRRSALGMSGLGLRTRCAADGVRIDLLRATGQPIHDDDRVLVVTIGAPTLSGNLAYAVFPGSASFADRAPVVREVVEDWFRRLGRLTQSQRDEALHRRSERADTPTADCVEPGGYSGGFTLAAGLVPSRIQR